MKQEKEPLVVIKPRFNAILFFLTKYLLTLLAVIFLMVVSTKINIISNDNIIIYFIIAIIVYLIYIVIRGLMQKRQYNLTKYYFYDDKIIIFDKRKRGQDIVIYYNEMYDILMTQNYLQRFFNQGELVIKLSDAKIFSKNVTLVGIANFTKTTQELATIIYGNQTVE